jgi:hypothetical protein
MNVVHSPYRTIGSVIGRGCARPTLLSGGVAHERVSRDVAVSPSPPTLPPLPALPPSRPYPPARTQPCHERTRRKIHRAALRAVGVPQGEWKRRSLTWNCVGMGITMHAAWKRCVAARHSAISSALCSSSSALSLSEMRRWGALDVCDIGLASRVCVLGVEILRRAPCTSRRFSRPCDCRSSVPATTRLQGSPRAAHGHHTCRADR